MAISLKQQLAQANQITEVTYHAPVFDKHYYDRAHKNYHSEGRASGRRMFYDFYAMEFLWSFLGSGQIPKAEREKLAALPPDDPSRDFISGKAHRFLPQAAVKTIDNVYEQVTHAVAKNLLAYIRMAVVQEFQYLVTQSEGWQSFRHAIVSLYNKQKTVSKADFQALIDDKIPGMKAYPDVVKKLLKYSKYYSGLATSDGKDVYDVSRKAAKKRAEKDTTSPVDTSTSEPETPKDTEPDTTNYKAKPTTRDFGKYGGPGQPEYPEKYPYSGLSAFKDPDDEDENGEKSAINEEMINTSIIRDVYKAMNQAGITLDDIEKAYNNIEWGGAFGGSRWGSGAIALLKLADAKKNLSTEDMNHIIDHIYDLQHNTGSLLNKGPMYVDDTDLNRRYKITDVARFIPFVSPVVKDLILRYQRFLRVDPKDAETEAQMEDMLKSPKLAFTPEETKPLTDMGFNAVDNSYRIAIKFKNKKGMNVGGVYYEISKHEPGKFVTSKNDAGVTTSNFVKSEGVPPVYVVTDNLKADVKAFDTFDRALSYLKSYQQDMIPNGDVGSSGAEPTMVTTKSDKDLYVDSHSRMKLSPDKEQMLLDINIGYRPKNKYYKAYFANGNRFAFYAFTDGSFLLAHTNSNEYKIFHDFVSALDYAKTQVVHAQQYPNKADAQTAIDIASGKISPAAAAKTPSPTTPDLSGAEFNLASMQVTELQSFINQLPKHQHETYFIEPAANGMMIVFKKKFHKISPLMGVGQLLDPGFGPAFKAVRYVNDNPMEKLSFASWSAALSYVQKQLSKTVTGSEIYPVSSLGQSGKELPPNSTSKASYSAHSGISTMPKNTIRLTKEDEDQLASVGFSPKLIGDNVWYTHNGTGDTAKFWPNNQATVLFVGKGHGNMNLKLSIDKAIAWIIKNYTQQSAQSPIKFGGKAVSPATLPVGSSIAKGIKPGTMFEKKIADAGLTWDENTGQYIDGDNTLKIYPNRASTLNVKNIPNVGDQVYQFKDLPQLMVFLTNTYPGLVAQKKSSPLTPQSEDNPQKITIIPSWMHNSLIAIMEKAHYKYSGPVSDHGYAYKNPEGDKVIAYPDEIYKVYDKIHDNWVDLKGNAEFYTYLSEKYGSAPAGNTPEVSPNLTKSEEDIVIELVSKFGMKGVKKYETPISEASNNQLQYVEVQNDIGGIYAIGKKGNYYVWSMDPNEPTNMSHWSVVIESNDFNQLLGKFEELLGNFTGNTGEGELKYVLTPDQLEWVETFVKNNVSNVKIEPATGGIYVKLGSDDQFTLFSVTKLPGTPFYVTYYYEDPNIGDGVTYSSDVFNTFSDLAAGIENNIEKYSQLKNQEVGASKSTGEKENPISIKETHMHDLFAAGFKETLDMHGFPEYMHGNDFVFQVWPHKIQWRTPGSTKEVSLSHDGVMEFLKVLDKCSSTLSGDKLDLIFSQQSYSPEEKAFNTLIEQASILKSVKVTNPEFNEGMADKKGFYWDNVDQLYVNEEAFQAVVVTIGENQKYNYAVFYLGENNAVNFVYVSSTDLFNTIGMDGSLKKEELASKEKSKHGGIVAPSNIHNLLANLGFHFSFGTGEYSKGTQSLVFYKNGVAKYKFVTNTGAPENYRIDWNDGKQLATLKQKILANNQTVQEITYKQMMDALI